MPAQLRIGGRLLTLLMIAGIAENLLLAAPEPNSVDVQERVTLVAPRGEIQNQGHRAIVTIRGEVTNRLPVAIDRVEIGVVFGESDEALRAVEPSLLYSESLPDRSGVGGLVREGLLRVEPGMTVPFVVSVDIGTPSWPVESFGVHLLGYGLRDITAEVVLALVGGPAVADEVAALRAFGLTESLSDQYRARKRWASKSELIDGLRTALLRSVEVRPSQFDVARRAYAALALGVLGPEASEGAFKRGSTLKGIERLDEVYQVLRIARLSGSAVTTPLAQALPAQATTFAEFLRSTREAFRRLDTFVDPVAEAAPVEDFSVSREAQTEPTNSPALSPEGRWLSLAGIPVALGLAWRARRRQKGSH